jgi:hypothetical protein
MGLLEWGKKLWGWLKPHASSIASSALGAAKNWIKPKAQAFLN